MINKDSIHRYTSRELPPYYFLPGKAKHPEKEGGYMHGREIKCDPLSDKNYRNNETYLYGLDLFNLGYFWEAHVYWEALWNVVGRKGKTADMLKALIKLAAAGVKFRLGQIDAAQGHLDRATELVNDHQITTYLGINIATFISTIHFDQLTSGKEFLFPEFLGFFDEI